MKISLAKFMPDTSYRIFASPYVAGVGVRQGVTTAYSLWKNHSLRSTIDLLAEDVTDFSTCEAIMKIYLETIRYLKDNSYCSISVKLSSLGSFLDRKYCEQNLRVLLEESSKHNIPLTIDMEDIRLTDYTLDTYHTLRPQYSNLRVVLQSRLFRTNDDISRLLKSKDQHTIRMCIGIYNESEDIAYTIKRDMKIALIEQSLRLLKAGHKIGLATHDTSVILCAKELFEKHDIPNDRIEFQMLLGVPRRNIQRYLIDEGYRVKLYVPFASDWDTANAYLRRRLQNNPNLVFYVLKNLSTDPFSIFQGKI